jgi:RNA polymerase sigma factor (sigma-70 family)
MKTQTPTEGLSGAELRDARRGFTLMLRRKRFSPEWIEENAGELLAQASKEYAAKLAAGLPADNPVGWLINCAWRRNQNLLESRTRKPRPSQLEAAFDLADESTPTPEEQALDHDRQERLRKALGHLPEKERKLLALVYFEDRSIREAGRILGWQKSVANRHHGAAMERLRALVGDRDLLSPATLGLAATIHLRGEADRASHRALDIALAPIRHLAALASEAAQAAAHRLTGLSRRLYPLSDSGAAATSSGAGRALGACGAGVVAVVCGLGAAGVVGPGVSAVAPVSHAPSRSTSTTQPKAPPADPVKKAAGVIAAPTPPTPTPAPQRRSEPAIPARVQAAKPFRAVERPARAQGASAKATPEQTANEFGIEPGSGDDSASEATPTPSPSPGSTGPVSSGAATPSAPARPATSTPKPSAPKPSGSSSGSEFGL